MSDPTGIGDVVVPNLLRVVRISTWSHALAILPWLTVRVPFPMSSQNQRKTTSAHSTNSWLLVVGMHRSGTSAITGALGALGFNTPHSRDRAGFKPESNSEHWESLSLSGYNEHLLAELGGSWDAPPDLPSKPFARILPATVRFARKWRAESFVSP